MARKAKNGSGRRRVGSLPSQITGDVGGSTGTGNTAHPVDLDGSDEDDVLTQEQRHVHAVAGKMKLPEVIDAKDNPSQITCARPSNMPSHISLGAPVTHRTAKDLTPTFLKDAKFEVSKPVFIQWFIANGSYQCRACARKAVSCRYPPVAAGTQRNFKCTACRNERGGSCSWLQDLLEVYIREAYQLDVGEARVLASSKENDPQRTLSSYYQTWLAEPAGRCSDDESRERLKALETAISWDRPRKRKKDSRVGSAHHHLLQQASAQYPSTQLSLPEPQPKPQKRVKLIVSLPPGQSPLSKASLPPSLAQGPSTPALIKISPGGSQPPPDRASLPPLPSRRRRSRSPPPRSPPRSPPPRSPPRSSPRSSPRSPPPPPPPPPPTACSPSIAASIQISPGGLPLLPTTPERFLEGHPPPPSGSLPISSGLCQPLSPATLAPVNVSPPTAAAIAALESHSNVPQAGSPAQVDNWHATFQHHPGDDLPNTTPDKFSASTDEEFIGADPHPPSYDIARLKSDMATLSDGLPKLIEEAGFFNGQEAESYLLKMLQGSLQTYDSLRSIVDQQDLRHTAVTRNLEDRICSLTLENRQLKQGVATKCLEQKICLLEIENDQLRGRLVRQDQELADEMLQWNAVKGLEEKIRQLEVEIDQLREKINQREQVVTTITARKQLADRVLRLTSQQDLPAAGDAGADTNLKGLVSMIHAHLDNLPLQNNDWGSRVKVTASRISNE
ncbi:hypothetical protein BDR04DRAFT_1163893 [Suillus decipiens]|nr:hypothetical protein BDR04DRAFT_1163893 [Suillus decipiens]